MEFTTVCEDCGKVFQTKTDKAFYCPQCRKVRLSQCAKDRNLSELGHEAKAKYIAEGKKLIGGHYEI